MKLTVKGQDEEVRECRLEIAGNGSDVLLIVGNECPVGVRVMADENIFIVRYRISDSGRDDFDMDKDGFVRVIDEV